MNYFCLAHLVGFWLKYMLKDNVDHSSQVHSSAVKDFGSGAPSILAVAVFSSPN